MKLSFPLTGPDSRSAKTKEARDNAPLKIVMILPECHAPPWGGTQKQALFLANRLQSQGVAITVVSKCQGLFHGNGRVSVQALIGMGIRENFRLVYFPSLRSLPAWSLLVSFLLWSLWNRNHFQIIHAHTAATGLIACLVAVITGKKVIVKFPSMKNVEYLRGTSRLRRLRKRILVSRAHCFVALNAEMATALRNEGVAEKKIALIPNGVEPNGTSQRHERRWIKRECLGDEDLRVVLFAGRLIEEKGLDRLLTAWRKTASRERSVLVIVGDGPLRRDLETMASQLGIRANVRFLGHRADVAKFYAIADLFVLPSRTEGMSNALLEAMAAGLPVVASDVGGNREIVEDGCSGFLVDWEDPLSCASVLSALIENPGLRQSMGEAARERARVFGMREVSDRYRQLYQAVL